MNFTLYIWRQADSQSEGRLVRYAISDISPDLSFLEMLDRLNEQLTLRDESPIAFDSDCREGICGMCSLMINGEAHGTQAETTTCQLYMRHFNDGDEITVEPWRANAFPVLRDLIVDRSSFDRIMQAGGYISVHTGPKPDPNAIPIAPEDAELALDAASCIGCGACVAACPNASAMLYVAAKVSHLGLLPQGQPERYPRVVSMVEQMQAEGFGACRNAGECQHACPKGITIAFIGQLNRDFRHAVLKPPEISHGTMETI
ncbi:MAG: succinate dehydrogenase/fumarate reductase iron-sulfur subunit [Gammaproteobacteria bacterium]|nr:MAG: succinate dehydrogenase/fumarate reductase iron-sulfur subunit [Gammaproteobacteria bacterium]